MTSIDEKMRKSRLRWFGHVQRKAINAPTRKSKLIQVKEMKKGKGKPKITFMEIVKRACQLRK